MEKMTPEEFAEMTDWFDEFQSDFEEAIRPVYIKHLEDFAEAAMESTIASMRASFGQLTEQKILIQETE